MEMMRATRDDLWFVGLPALALALAAGSLPAAAQSGSEAVVCVGSETRIHQGNPIRRFYTEDMEVMYRIGVDIGQRSQIERTLGSELGSYPEVWCAWSDPGDDHAVIVGYTGVIRQDLTVDPEDPRFQAFSVGFGTSFDEAETGATTISQRFSSQNDGSGYEVLPRETWSVAEGIAAEVSEPEPNLPEGRTCTEVYSPDSCWMELADRPGMLRVESSAPGERDGYVEWVFKRPRRGETDGSPGTNSYCWSWSLSVSNGESERMAIRCQSYSADCWPSWEGGRPLAWRRDRRIARALHCLSAVLARGARLRPIYAGTVVLLGGGCHGLVDSPFPIAMTRYE